MRLECLGCADAWARETRCAVVRGFLRPRPQPGEVRINGDLAATWGVEEYACDGCNARLAVGSVVAAITGGGADARWWRDYVIPLPSAETVP